VVEVSSEALGATWIIPSNPRTFDTEAAFQALAVIDWSEAAQSKTVAPGDVVYLYSALPVKAITHKCLVLRTGVPFAEVIDDRAYWVDQEALADRQGQTWMRLRLLVTLDDAARSHLDLATLKEHGLRGNMAGRLRPSPGLLAYIKAVEATSLPHITSDDASAEGGLFDEAEVEQFAGHLEAGRFSVQDRYATTKTRASAQRAFADQVKRNYGYRCAITGITTPEFLVASHIVPWSEDEAIRLDPANGICLSTLVDRAFDAGFLTIDERSVAHITYDKLHDDTLAAILAPYDGQTLAKPATAPPNPDYLRRRMMALAPRSG
jgi:hypothetical protein